MTTSKKRKIKNFNYRKFLDEGIINTISEDDILQALDNVKGKRGRFIKEGRALLITLYYTGARPVEVLRMKAKDFVRDKAFLKLKLTPSKRGLPRTIYLPWKLPLVKELYDYVKPSFPEMYVFWHYRTRYERHTMIGKNKDKPKVYVEITDGLRHYFRTWFAHVLNEGIPPYYLRHNRMSKLSMAGVTMEELRQVKGSRTFDSIIPYLHMSEKSAKSVAKKME